MTIRQFVEGDETRIIDLILPIQTEEFGIPITADDQPDLKNIRAFYCKGNGNFWVAVEQGSIVGTIALIDIGNSQVALRKMFVKREFRGKEQGIAQRLTDTVFEWCRQKKVTDIFLGTIEPFKAAQRFYERNGFVFVEPEKLPPNFPRMAVDNMFYHYTFNP